jgi:hypothetical protein
MSHSTRPLRSLLLLALVLVPGGAMAQAKETTQDLEYPEPAYEGKDDRHGISVFLGDTYSDGENGFTLGLGYEYRFTRRIGIGGMVDYVGRDFRSFVAGIPISFHATQRLEFELAAGVEYADGDYHALVRLGVGYGFPVGPVALAPMVAADFVDSETVYLAGLSVEWEF